MLFTSDGSVFCAGLRGFLDHDPTNPEVSAKLFVPIAVGEFEVLAQIDTGAPYSILSSEVAVQLGLTSTASEEINISTRHGSFKGRLERTVVSLLAEEGESLQFEATFFIPDQWPSGSFIGWAGFLERVRSAIDPANNLFYFGAAA